MDRLSFGFVIATAVNKPTLTELFDQISKDGPKIPDPLSNKYIDLTGLETDIDSKTKNNILASLISSSVGNAQYAQHIYNLCETDEYIAHATMEYLITQKFSSSAIKFFMQTQDACVERIFPEINKYKLDEENSRKKVFIETYGFSVPSTSAINLISKFCTGKPILSIGCGISSIQVT